MQGNAKSRFGRAKPTDLCGGAVRIDECLSAGWGCYPFPIRSTYFSVAFAIIAWMGRIEGWQTELGGIGCEFFGRQRRLDLGFIIRVYCM
jgi:hypothetical protein